MVQLKLALLSFCVICLVAILSGCGGSSGNVSGSGSWSIALLQSGNFAAGGTGQYAITVTNNTSAATSGTVTVTDTLPSVFTANGSVGSGWTCTLSPFSCTTSNSIAPGANSTITLNVNVSASASGSYTNQAAVSGGGPTNASGSIQTTIGVGGGNKIQHVVIIIQENRSTDNLFQGLCIAPLGNPSDCGTGQNQYNIQNYGYVGTNKVSLTPVAQGLVTCNAQGENCYDLGHGHDGFLKDCDWNGTECAMDGWSANQCNPGAYCPKNPQLQYVPAPPGSNMQTYIQLAQTYAFGDNMFQSNQGPSFPAHQYLFGGTTAVCLPGASDCPPGTTSTVFVSGNPGNNDRADGTPGVGCLAPPGSNVKIIDTSQPFPNKNESLWDGSECMDRPTMADLLNSAGRTWRYYANTDGDIWNAPDAIQEICMPTGPQDQLYCNGTQWNNNVILEGSGAQILTDIQAGELANVTWVAPDGPNSDHPSNTTDNGPSWVNNIVTAIGQSPFWANTAIIVTWDDWGGWFDHVAPPIRNNPDLYPNSYEYGYRVPIIVISPYGKQNYISHQQNDFGGILLFIEEQFGLPTIGSVANPPVAYADSYALGDLSDFFDFGQAPLPFTPIQSEHDAEFFINSKVAPTPPDND
ncbi:MAG: alkaline phosphatase family protein [Terriglobales bacterium]